MRPPVFSPGFFIVTRIKRSLLPVTNRGDPIFRDSKVDQILFGAVGPSFSEGEIIFIGSSFITVAFDLNFDIRELLQEGSILF